MAKPFTTIALKTGIQFDRLLQIERSEEVTLTGIPEGLHVFRTEPDADDPNWSTFDYWYLVPRVEGAAEVATLYGVRRYREAEHKTGSFDQYQAKIPLGDFLSQDLSLAVTQQRGLHSMAFEKACLCDQETRVTRFHEVINDCLEGRR
jgi:Ring hydroxylating alpha subunit (catalytic domain)